MKKISSLGTALAMLLCSFSISFVTDVTTPANEEITPRFVEAKLKPASDTIVIPRWK